MTSRYAGKMLVGSVATAVREDGRVLMIRRQKEPYIGLWCMPGGKIEVGEHPDLAAVREFREETGLEAEVERFCGSVSEVLNGGDSGHFLLYVFRLKVTGGSLNEGVEGPLQWLSPEELVGKAVPSDEWMVCHLILAGQPPTLVTIQATEQDFQLEQVYG